MPLEHCLVHSKHSINFTNATTIFPAPTQILGAWDWGVTEEKGRHRCSWKQVLQVPPCTSPPAFNSHIDCCPERSNHLSIRFAPTG